MSTIWERIAATKREEVAELRRRGCADTRSAPVRDILAALRDRQPIGLIAELKKASPSRGVIRADFDAQCLARAYADGGAHVLSILTDRQYFQGDAVYLRQARDACPLPVLRKDFIIHELQVRESAGMNADAVLLIVAMLEQSQLEDLYACCCAHALTPLVEVHDEREMERACALHAALVGINNRDLHTFNVDVATTERVARYALPEMLLVSESGIFTADDITRVRAAGATAVLVGESLMRQDDVAAAVHALLRTSRD